jgi:hypothetical protein
MLSSGLFTGVCGLNTDVSEHTVYSIFIVLTYEDGTVYSETLAFKPQTQVNNPEESLGLSKSH